LVYAPPTTLYGMEPLTTGEVLEQTNMTLRRLDYLVRSAVISPRVPATGSGTQRKWAPEQVRVLRFIQVLRAHGADYDTLRPAVREAERLNPDVWTARVLVTLDGRITTLLGGDSNGWVVDLAHCRDRVTVGGELVAA
jgi:DNA-binding transcriptional MerR regulator